MLFGWIHERQRKAKIPCIQKGLAGVSHPIKMVRAAGFEPAKRKAPFAPQ
jgi:hypothetical protein